MEKAKENYDHDEKVERVLRKLFPGFGRITPKVKKLISDFDPAAPRTTLMKAENLLDSLAAIPPVHQRLFLRFIKIGTRSKVFRAYMMRQLDVVIKITKAEAGKDPRYALLLKLMHEVDQKAPFAAYLVTDRHGDPRESFEIQSDPIPYFHAAVQSTGEKRAKAATEAFRRTVEHLYTPYIKTLVCLSYVREGKSRESLKDVTEMKLGVALDHLDKKLTDYTQLFDVRAGWMRNAVTHTVPFYDPKTDTLVLVDKKNSIEINTADLLEIAEVLYQLSAKTIVFVSQLYLFREIYRDTGLREIFMEYLPRLAWETDPLRIRLLEGELNDRVQNAFRLSSLQN